MEEDLRRHPGPHAFVEDLDAPTLREDDHHHLARALRLRVGDPLSLSDGAGRWRAARFAPEPEPDGPIIDVAEPPWPVHLVFALTKSGKPELVVQKATELGVESIVIFGGEHSVPRWDEAKRAKALPRLERVAREAAMQSRRVRLPSVDIVSDLAAACAHVAVPVVRADFGPTDAPQPQPLQAIAIGPEGGWSKTECTELPSIVDLGPTVLRAETAAVVAAATLTSMRQMGHRDYP